MDSIEDIQAPFESVEFLARSSNRVEVLDELQDEPRTRGQLNESIGASRVTLDRILDDLEALEWVVRSSERYGLTPQGTFVTTEIKQLLSRIEATERTEPKRRHGSAIDPWLADIEFLARSPNRLEVLDMIRAAPRTRRELKNATEISRATLSRILTELEERDWIEGTNHRYEATQRGTDIGEAFTRFLSNLETARELDDVMGWLPTDEFDFELACLCDAKVIPADYWEEPTRSIHHVAELIRSADHARIVGPGAAREVADSVRTLTVKRDGTFDGVMEPQGVETIRDDEVLREHFKTILASGRATIACHQKDRPFLVVAIVDDTVVLCGSEDRNVAHDTVETDHDRVGMWAESYVDAAIADAQPLAVDAFTP